MRFRALEADVLAYSSRTGRLELGEGTFASLTDLASSVEDLMACYPQLTALEAERLAQRLQDRDVPAIMGHMADMLVTAENSEVVLPSARDALAFGNDLIQDNTEVMQSPFASNDEVVAATQSRAKIIGQKLLDYRNFAVRVILQAGQEANHASEAARHELAGVAADSWKEIKKGFVKGIGKGAEKAAGAIIPGTFAALAAALAGPLAGISVVVACMAPLGRRAQEFGATQEESPADDPQDIQNRSQGEAPSDDSTA
jgi:hypothetical protein